MPIVEEHVSMCLYGDQSVYSRYPMEFDDLVARNQWIESLDGVLEAHVGFTVKDGKRYYLHHYRSVDVLARERALLGAQSNNADFLVSVCEKARQVYQKMANVHGITNELSCKHRLSSKRLDTECSSIILADWTTEGSSNPQAKYPAICMGVVKAKEGISAEVLEDCVTEFRSLPARFPLLGQVSVGRTDSAPYVGPQHYPSTGVVDWDVGFVFSYASANDRRELDSDPEFEAIHKKWRSVLGDDNYQIWDLEVGSRWREFQGGNEWKGLLNPLSVPLARDLIRYGRLLKACYANFGNGKKCKALSKSRAAMVEAILPEGYDVKDEFYTEEEKTNKIGFLGVSNPDLTKLIGRIDIVIVFRGSKSIKDWWHNIQYLLSSDPNDYTCGIATGYQNYARSLKKTVLPAIKEAINTSINGHDHLSLTFVGHSLGGALALLCAKDFAEDVNHLDQFGSPHYKIRTTVFSLGSPKVGNRCFRETIDKLGVSLLRVVHKKDTIGMLPPPWHMFVHAGVELKIGCSSSVSARQAHSLDEYLRCLEEDSIRGVFTNSKRKDDSRRYCKFVRPLEDAYMNYMGFADSIFKYPITLLKTCQSRLRYNTDPFRLRIGIRKIGAGILKHGTTLTRSDCGLVYARLEHEY